ncbi:hypothetical protein D3C79_961950 [compost metagenome]
MGNLAQQRQGRADTVLVRLFEQLHADIVHDFAGKAAVAETMTNLVDQFVVVTHEGLQQRWLGGIGLHVGPGGIKTAAPNINENACY